MTAHGNVSYLLAPQTSPMGGIGGPSTRIVLLGSQSPQLFPAFHKDPDAIIFSEIAEFAMSLATTPKGQDAFNGLPHLQVYKFMRATSLAEMGHMQLASR
jgi:COPII coat assembly protein SEC16